MMASSPSATYWLSRARWLALGVNAAWTWQRFVPVFAGINLLFAAYILIARRSGEAVTAGLPAYLVLIALALGWSLWRGRGKYFSRKDALLRLETALGLKNRLSCAAEGIVDWPEPEAYRGRAVGLRPQAALLPLVYSGAFILAGLWLPIQPVKAGPVAGDAVEPSAWTQVADWAELLREERIVAPEEVEKLEEQLDELRNRPQEEWYTQGSLEAGEALRDETRLAMQELARQLQSTSTFLEEMARQQENPMMGSAEAEQLDQAWLKQLEQLQAGSPGLDPEMMSQLKTLSFSQMSSLSPEQLQQMQERLQQGAGQCGGAAGLSELDLEAVTLQVRQMGTGAPQRGPGPAPLVMADEGTSLNTATREGVSNQDMRNAALGETVGISSRPGNDEQAETFEGGATSGGASSLGTGGDAVWRESYTPDERAILEQYFK
ncbi:hypothetical protein H5P28_09110 [Ruficoccus amylovorans]|uniref:Uncharacterized protein n=1 Tax=Ruficoccus amylovorans TaxID=1804625 RepID=A0A842HFV5_9BACT|nr:hypothetical protein [Ruficoccus amylovorans]MBC2594414.1 hypothetical protein [Ruficoccus amylovorans]